VGIIILRSVFLGNHDPQLWTYQTRLAKLNIPHPWPNKINSILITCCTRLWPNFCHTIDRQTVRCFRMETVWNQKSLQQTNDQQACCGKCARDNAQKVWLSCPLWILWFKDPLIQWWGKIWICPQICSWVGLRVVAPNCTVACHRSMGQWGSGKGIGACPSMHHSQLWFHRSCLTLSCCPWGCPWAEGCLSTGLY